MPPAQAVEGGERDKEAILVQRRVEAVDALVLVHRRCRRRHAHSCVLKKFTRCHVSLCGIHLRSLSGVYSLVLLLLLLLLLLWLLLPAASAGRGRPVKKERMSLFSPAGCRLPARLPVTDSALASTRDRGKSWAPRRQPSPSSRIVIEWLNGRVPAPPQVTPLTPTKLSMPNRSSLLSRHVPRASAAAHVHAGPPCQSPQCAGNKMAAD